MTKTVASPQRRDDQLRYEAVIDLATADRLASPTAPEQADGREQRPESEDRQDEATRLQAALQLRGRLVRLRRQVMLEELARGSPDEQADRRPDRAANCGAGHAAQETAAHTNG